MKTHLLRCMSPVWHNSEITACAPDVRFRRQTRKHVLAASISEFDPDRTSA
jgi:hypothetical protein